ncbi:hypothetical protein [Paractinoplanes lichenicola]|uniref:hypothetical protein n=1 Tax=Paractinoplanes lichenicola TaxID=2802976 RepID=UPI001931FAA5|nr:hypothetical protein [Actinoplanes lichenicola]
MRAELGKLASLPGLRWTASLTWAATALLAFAAHRAVPAEDPVLTALRWTQVGFLILGVLAATQEYEAGGQIRATLLAAPRRNRLAAAKAIAVAVASVVMAAPIVLAPPAPLRPSWAAYLVGVTLIGVAAGLLFRNALAATTVLLTTYLVACPLLRSYAPASSPWLPDTALLEPSRGAAAATLWPLALLTVAALAFRRRNA